VSWPQPSLDLGQKREMKPAEIGRGFWLRLCSGLSFTLQPTPVPGWHPPLAPTAAALWGKMAAERGAHLWKAVTGEGCVSGWSYFSWVLPHTGPSLWAGSTGDPASVVRGLPHRGAAWGDPVVSTRQGGGATSCCPKKLTRSSSRAREKRAEGTPATLFSNPSVCSTYLKTEADISSLQPLSWTGLHFCSVCCFRWPS